MLGQKKTKSLSLLSSLLLATAILFSLMKVPTPAAGQEQSSPTKYDTIFTVPTGEKGVTYTVKREEELQWGPSALAAAPDGSLWIANRMGKNLLQFSRDGDLMNTIDLKGMVVGAGDLRVTADAIFVLDEAAHEPAVVQLSHRGAELARYAIPEELRAGMSGLAFGENGELLLEHEGALSHQLLDARGQLSLQSLPGRTINGQPLIINKADWSTNRSRTTVSLGDTLIEIAVANDLGAVRLLDVAPDRSFFLSVEELSVADALHVDLTIRHYNADGKLLGIARFPLSDLSVEIAHPLTVAADGEVYGLITRLDHVELVRMSFSATLPTVLPAQRMVAEPTQTECAIYRSTIASNANAYINNSKYLNSTNTDGACSGRGKPDYLGGAGTYRSVPYDWGGWDTVGGFNSLMDQGYKAGDVATSSVESCSKGVDCSGFVTRAWGISSQKYGTSTLGGISTQLGSTSYLKQGDIMNDAGSHVRLIASISSSGAYVWEATTGSYDRVIYRYLSWSSQSGYVPRRYNSVCDGGTTPPPPSTEAWPIVREGHTGERVRTVQYLLRGRGYSLTVDGIFGSGTASAVRSFQSANGLTVDGIVGDQTWPRLITTVRNGSTGDAVRALQSQLKSKGYTITVDGIFGSGTESTVRSFQSARGLTVDGIVGAQTWKELVE